MDRRRVTDAPWGTGPPPRWPGQGQPRWADGRHWHGGQPLWPGRDRRWRRQWRRDGGPLRRVREGSIAGGVASGLSARTGMSVTAIRIGFVVTALMSGFGAAAYVLAWLFLPARPAPAAHASASGAASAGATAQTAGAMTEATAAGQPPTIASKALSDRRGIALAAASGSVLALLILISSALGIGWLGSLSWFPVIALAGLILIWRNAPPDEQEILRRLAEPLTGDPDAARRSRLGLRLGVAAVLLLAGLATALTGHPSRLLLRPLGGLILMVAAIVVVLGPWWLRVVRDLMTERQARVRAEERAEMASRVHDSVLQTLALIQRRAADPQQVVALARAQERELRSWLFGGRAPGSMDGLATTLAAGIRVIQQEVEAAHGIVVDVITVGDCPIDDDVAALLAAAREATVNAAKWSGAGTVSMYAEVEPAEISVFVRDRGRGFDTGAVPADRKGVTESIVARMARHGGSASIRSAPGEGTEVTLSMTSPDGYGPSSSE